MNQPLARLRSCGTRHLAAKAGAYGKENIRLGRRPCRTADTMVACTKRERVVLRNGAFAFSRRRDGRAQLFRQRC